MTDKSDDFGLHRHLEHLEQTGHGNSPYAKALRAAFATGGSNSVVVVGGSGGEYPDDPRFPPYVPNYEPSPKSDS